MTKQELQNQWNSLSTESRVQALYEYIATDGKAEKKVKIYSEDAPKRRKKNG